MYNSEQILHRRNCCSFESILHSKYAFAAQIRTLAHEACLPHSPNGLDYPHVSLNRNQRNAARAVNALHSILEPQVTSLGAKVGVAAVHKFDQIRQIAS